MIQELVYTSVPQGLKPGSRGFCTVLCTQGMPAPVVEALEGLSGYKHIYMPGDPLVERNPVGASHLLCTIAGRKVSVLSRVANDGVDYTKRTNKLAHHVMLDFADRVAAGPAQLLMHPGFMHKKFEGDPRVVAPGRKVPDLHSEPAVCRAWEAVTGDAGWGGVLAESFMTDSARLAYLTFTPGFDPLPLIAESIALLPPERRWDVTFSTYFTSLPGTATCLWRCVVAGSSEANESRRHVQAPRISLGEPLAAPASGPWVEFARTGVQPSSSPGRRATTSAKESADTRLAASSALERGETYRLGRPSAPPPPMPTGLSSTLPVPPAPAARRFRSPLLLGLLAGFALLAVTMTVVGLMQRAPATTSAAPDVLASTGTPPDRQPTTAAPDDGPAGIKAEPMASPVTPSAPEAVPSPDQQPTEPSGGGRPRKSFGGDASPTPDTSPKPLEGNGPTSKPQSATTQPEPTAESTIAAVKPAPSGTPGEGATPAPSTAHQQASPTVTKATTLVHYLPPPDSHVDQLDLDGGAAPQAPLQLRIAHREIEEVSLWTPPEMKSLFTLSTGAGDRTRYTLSAREEESVVPIAEIHVTGDTSASGTVIQVKWIKGIELTSSHVTALRWCAMGIESSGGSRLDLCLLHEQNESNFESDFIIKSPMPSKAMKDVYKKHEPRIAIEELSVEVDKTVHKCSTKPDALPFQALGSDSTSTGSLSLQELLPGYADRTHGWGALEVELLGPDRSTLRINRKKDFEKEMRSLLQGQIVGMLKRNSDIANAPELAQPLAGALISGDSHEKPMQNILNRLPEKPPDGQSQPGVTKVDFSNAVADWRNSFRGSSTFASSWKKARAIVRMTTVLHEVGPRKRQGVLDVIHIREEHDVPPEFRLDDEEGQSDE